jgi:hypothetical protein
VQSQLENRLQAITDSTEAEDLKVEKDLMEHQLQLVRTQMRRAMRIDACIVRRRVSGKGIAPKIICPSYTEAASWPRL